MEDTVKLIEWNEKNGIKVFRLSSQLFPHKTNPSVEDYTYDFAYVGNYALNLKVFGKQGEKCPRCKYKITKTKVAQRGTHYCKKCQKK